MGLGSFFRKLFGSTEPAGSSYSEPKNDAVKDASDVVITPPELVPEQTEPVVEKTSAFAHDPDEDAFEGRDEGDYNRFEEPAD